MRKLQASGFKVVHLHGNDFTRPYKKNGYSIPSALEVIMGRESMASGKP